MTTPRTHAIGFFASTSEEKKSDSTDPDVESSDVRPPPRPIKTKFATQYKEVKKFEKVTFHQIKQLSEELSDQIIYYFFKENTPGSPVSELEAGISECYRFLARNYIPATHAVFDKSKGKFIGVVSEEIQKFKSTAVDPLTEEDLIIEFKEDEDIALLDALEHELQDLEKAAQEAERKKRKLIARKKQHKLEKKRYLEHPASFSEIDALRLRTEDSAIKKASEHDESLDAADAIRLFYKKLAEKHSISEKQLRRYRIIKGSAIALTASYIFEEEDLHQNNWSKFGHRIDFDMSFWPLMYNFKDETLVVFRKPKENSFQVTKSDLVNFPYIVDAKPSYWPTTSLGSISESLSAALKKFFPLSTNPYPYQINALYQRLSFHPVFKYHFFSMLAKYILGNEEIYKNLLLLHICPENSFESKLLYGVMANHHAQRIKEFKKVLLTMPEFCKFFKKHSERIKNEVIKDLKASEIIYDASKIEEAATNFINTIDHSKAEEILRKESKDSKEELKISPPSFEAFESIKKNIITEMTNYIPNTWFHNKSHIELATTFINETKILNPDPSHPKEIIDCVVILKTKIDRSLKKVPFRKDGGMYPILIKIQSSLNTAFPDIAIDKTATSPTEKISTPSNEPTPIPLPLARPA